MSKPIDRAFYARRISEERARAETALDWAAASVHRETAELYEDLLTAENASGSRSGSGDA